MPTKVLITGFGAFDRFDENPSAWLAEHSGQHHIVLPVTFGAADRFASALGGRPEDVILHLGVAGNAKRMRVERAARNVIGPTLDVRGRRPARDVIRLRGPERLATTLFWNVPFGSTEGFEMSEDPGSYLCNYLYFQSLWWAGAKQIGFLHVPPFEVIPRETQREMLQVVLDWIGTIRGS